MHHSRSVSRPLFLDPAQWLPALLHVRMVGCRCTEIAHECGIVRRVCVMVEREHGKADHVHANTEQVHVEAEREHGKVG